jgi:predicted transcriptional regulator
MPKLSAVVPEDIASALKERARGEDRSVGAVIRRAIAEHVGRRAGNGQPAQPERKEDG